MDVHQIYKLWNECGRKHSTDTRKIIQGGIFFALKGVHFNGNDFAAEALNKGAAFAVVDEEKYVQNEKTVLVSNVLTALQQLATYHRLQLNNTRFIALTGSNGKTTTKELVRSILEQQFHVKATQGNLNNHIGVPLTLLEVNEQHEFAIIEMGANHQKEIAQLCEIALPDFGFVTNVGKAHLEGFGGMEGVIKGKGEMYDFLKKHQRPVFMNADNALLIQRCGQYPHLITYGTSEKNYCKGSFELKREGIWIRWQAKNNSGQAQSNLTGAYNFENLLSAVCIGCYFGVPADKIRKGIEAYLPENKRSQVVVKNETTFILDYYNANPTSMEAAIKTLKENFNGKKMAVLGQMLELGDDSSKEHAYITGLLLNSGIETVLVGRHFEGLEKALNARFFKTSEEAAAYLKLKNLMDYTVLIKGSRGSKMEAVAEALLA
jgi:UDP-N-acetylmuramoyl-tripeptide--D-alanyl-D-alanine ligase